MSYIAKAMLVLCLKLIEKMESPLQLISSGYVYKMKTQTEKNVLNICISASLTSIEIDSCDHVI